MVRVVRTNSIGAWAFLIGVVLAIILGLFSAKLAGIQGIVLLILLIVWLLVGLFNVSGGESSKFLLAGIVLVIVSSMGQDAMPGGIIGGYLASVLNALLVLFIPATIVVALKSVFAIARD